MNLLTNNSNIRAIFTDHWKSLELLKKRIFTKNKNLLPNTF